MRTLLLPLVVLACSTPVPPPALGNPAQGGPPSRLTEAPPPIPLPRFLVNGREVLPETGGLEVSIEPAPELRLDEWEIERFGTVSWRGGVQPASSRVQEDDGAEDDVAGCGEVHVLLTTWRLNEWFAGRAGSGGVRYTLCVESA